MVLAAPTQQAFSGSLQASYVHISRRDGLPPEPPEAAGHRPVIPKIRTHWCLLLSLSEQDRNGPVTPLG